MNYLEKISPDFASRIALSKETSLAKKIEKIYLEDTERQKTWTPFNDKNGLTYSYNAERQCFVSIDGEKEWIQEIDTAVPGYWFYCHQQTGLHPKGYPVICGARHLVLITEDGDKIKCHLCKKESVIKLEIDPKSAQYELLQELKKEK